MNAKTPAALKLANDIAKALAKSDCTVDETWFAFAVNISYLLAEVPPRARRQGIVDLGDRIEEMIAYAKETGTKGAEFRRDH